MLLQTAATCVATVTSTAAHLWDCALGIWLSNMWETSLRMSLGPQMGIVQVAGQLSQPLIAGCSAPATTCVTGAQKLWRQNCTASGWMTTPHYSAWPAAVFFNAPCVSAWMDVPAAQAAANGW